MKKNTLKPMLVASLMLSTFVTPVFAENTSNYSAYKEYYTNNGLDLVEGTFIKEGVFYNESLGFSFRIPPLWEGHFTIFQHHNHTIFMLNEGDFLFGISVFDKGENADVYHVVPENFADNFITLHEIQDTIFAIRIFERNESSTVEPEFFEMMQFPINGIDDLFGLIERQDINNYLSETDYKENDELILAEGTFIENEVFYNEPLGFSFRIPPLWEGNFTIFQHHNNTIFMLNEGDFLFGISVFDKSENADVYHIVPENFDDNFMVLHETENTIFAIRVFERNESSTVEPEFFEMMLAPVNGIDDLFSILEAPSENTNIEIVAIDGLEMTPLAVYARTLGYEVSWNGHNQTVELTRDGYTLTIQVGNLEYTSNGVAGTFGTAPVIHENRVFVEIGFLNLLI